MCGIIGYIGDKSAPGVLMNGLAKLEYRGYDSAGLVVVNDKGLDLRRSVGKLSALESLLQKEPVHGRRGIGHTRWATHGRPTEENAHPHMDCGRRVVVVHNGIIENYIALKADLIGRGHAFTSQTDTEVVAHLIEEALRTRAKNGALSERDYVDAVREAVLRLRGAYALGVLSADFPDVIIGARKECPLIVGLGEDECFLASDVTAILQRTRDAVFLNDGEMAVLKRESLQIAQLESGEPVEKKVTHVAWDPIQAEKAGYRHFMLKEIHEQPRTIEDTLLGRLNLDEWQVYLDTMKFNAAEIQSIKKVVITACGTSWHSGLVGKFLVERWIGLPCEVDIASEFRYRNAVIGPGDLLVTISQSGETADTIAAMRHAKEKGAHTLSICNVSGSTLAREAHSKVYTRCGPEIGVASTKAFTAQLTVLYLLSLYGALIRGTLSKEQVREIMQSLLLLPGWVTETLKREKKIVELARKFHTTSNFLFLGRNLNYPIALEGALKLKEISYIHAEGYPAGEMKHGPIALIDENMPVVAIATQSAVYEKVLSNIQEVKARGGIVIALATEGDERVPAQADHTVFLPAMPEFLSPCVNVVPLQLLAYHIAVLRGCDVDQPRNLAKSVTVE
ncbi:MAG: glutamine--fructose-6-phosphate transaminase (isomerizing) [Elusimicrobia bacterium]|nr:glutamine--fructose-6-phosphate transaminase (isomerizing) [Elusimicrobiota bacterium]